MNEKVFCIYCKNELKSKKTRKHQYHKVCFDLVNTYNDSDQPVTFGNTLLSVNDFNVLSYLKENNIEIYDFGKYFKIFAYHVLVLRITVKNDFPDVSRVPELVKLQRLILKGNSHDSKTRLEFPAHFDECKNLVHINLSDIILEKLSLRSPIIPSLKIITFTNVTMSKIPIFIYSSPNLKRLDIHESKRLLFLDTNLYNMDNLIYLAITECNIDYLRPEIGKLSKLKFLNVSKNLLAHIPSSIGQLKDLLSVNFSFNHITIIPPELFTISTLSSISIKGNPITTLPNSILSLKKLKKLIIDTQILDEQSLHIIDELRTNGVEINN